MGKHCKDLEDCRTYTDFERYVRQHGGDIEPGKGSHMKVRGPQNGVAVIPNHSGDIPTGTRRSICKQLAAILAFLALVGGLIITYL